VLRLKDGKHVALVRIRFHVNGGAYPPASESAVIGMDDTVRLRCIRPNAHALKS